MLHDEFIADKDNPHTKEGNPSVKCNMLSKTSKSFNCYLKPVEAIALARHLLSKAQIILESDISDGVVHLWNVGELNEKIGCGLNKARKRGNRRAATRPSPKETVAND